MKAIMALVTAALVAGSAALAMTFRAETLPVDDEFKVSIPVATPPPGFRIAALHTGRMYSKAAFSYRGGSFNDERVFGMTAVLLDHPQGKLLVDAGFGRNVDQHILTTPLLMRALSKYDKGTPAADQLRAAGIEPGDLKGIVITHAHWDHVSGIEDLPGVPVWVTREERRFIKDCTEPAALACSFGELPYHEYAFPSGPYLGFEHSYDVFGDGSVVIVPTPGHTPGEIALFATLPNGRRFAFIGDTAWQSEGVELPAERPWLPRWLLKEDGKLVRKWLVHLHQLHKRVPGLTVVPAHDQRVLETLPGLAAGGA